MNAVLTSSVGDILVGCGLLIVLVSLAVGYLRFGRDLRLKVGKMSAEFGNNGGSTLRDAIDRIEKRQIVIEEQVTNVAQRVDTLEHPNPKPAPVRKAAPRKKAS